MALSRRWKLAIVVLALCCPSLFIPIPALAYLILAFLLWISLNPERRTVALVVLAVYWPTLFILAHIPVPQLVRRAGVSDKALHFLAYLILTFLLWFVFNPDRRAHWRKAGVWWALLTVVVYGIIDELLQKYVGRTCDVGDLGADLAGAFTGLIVLSLFSFWPAATAVLGIVIFGLSNVARVNPAELLPLTNAMFHLFAYAGFTFLWIRCISPVASLKPPGPKWMMAAPALPVALLLAVKGYSARLGRGFGIQEVILSVAGIAVVVGIVCAASFLRRGRLKTQEPSSDDN